MNLWEFSMGNFTFSEIFRRSAYQNNGYSCWTIYSKHIIIVGTVSKNVYKKLTVEKITLEKKQANEQMNLWE